VEGRVCVGVGVGGGGGGGGKEEEEEEEEEEGEEEGTTIAVRLRVFCRDFTLLTAADLQTGFCSTTTTRR